MSEDLVQDDKPHEDVTREGREAGARAYAWAASVPGTPYGGAAIAHQLPGSGAAPDPPRRDLMPRLRGGDACG
jgi:hypothetical protein